MNERERVILGGLLHDIGKFYMRTGQPAEGYGREEWREDTGAAGAHARWSASFFSQYVPSQWREAGWLALTHHAPKEDPLSRVVQEADHLAASFDRTKRPTDERGDISRDRLEALCEQIVLPRQGRNGREPGRSFAHALQPLGLRREAVFPGERWPEGSLQHEYGGLWDAFTADAGRLGRAHEGRPDTFDAYVTTLLGLLERYTWCVPSATYRDYPNIPLYDHLKVTAAVAVCLHATDWAPGSECRFLFVEGDLGGIQAFLYESAAPSQTQEGTAQRLRGKSFFLDLAMRTLAERLRRDLELPACNILWCSGGHFALLAPDTSAVREAVARFRDVADRWCWEEFLGDVGVAVAAIPATQADLANVGTLLERAGQGLAEEKHRRFASCLRDPRFWTLPLKNEVCRACGRDVDKSVDFPPEAEAEDAQKKCPRCREFEAYGQRLPRTGALGLVPYQEGEEDTAGFPTLGLAWRLLGEGDNAPETTSLVLALGGVRNRDLRFLPERILPTSGYGVTPYSTILPMDGPRPRTFDRMAESARGAFPRRAPDGCGQPGGGLRSRRASGGQVAFQAGRALADLRLVLPGMGSGFGCRARRVCDLQRRGRSLPRWALGSDGPRRAGDRGGLPGVRLREYRPHTLGRAGAREGAVPDRPGGGAVGGAAQRHGEATARPTAGRLRQSQPRRV